MNKPITLAKLNHWIDGATAEPSDAIYLDNVNPMTGGAGPLGGRRIPG